MAINSTNSLAIAFNKLSGKVHTQQNFAVTEEGISTNVQMSYSTVFANPIVKLPVTASGMSALYATNGIVERVKFQIDIIPDTQIAVGKSQGYRLKLPSDYNVFGKLFPEFSAGTYLHTALGKLQIVPSLYGTLKLDGSTEYDPILYQTNGSTVIPKFDPINWYFDPYSGILFIQDPPAGYDSSAARPGYLEAFLYVGDYLDDIIFNINSGNTGTTAINVGTGVGVFKDKNINTFRFKSISGNNGIAVSGTSNNIILSFTGATGGGTITGATNGLTTFGKKIGLGGGLTGDTKITGTGSTLSFGTSINKLKSIELGAINSISLTGNSNVIKLDTTAIKITPNSSNNFVVGRGININTGGTKTDNYYFGLNHTDTISGGGNNRWNTVMGENHFVINDGTGATKNLIDSFILGSFFNKMHVTSAGGILSASGIVGALNSMIEVDGVSSFASQIFGGVANLVTPKQSNGTSGVIMGNYVLGGGHNISNGHGSGASGYWSKSSGAHSFVHGYVTSFVGGGWNLDSSFNPDNNPAHTGSVPRILGSGKHAINISANSTGQTNGHGAIGDYSVILGGIDHNISTGSTNSVVLGGNRIKVTTGITNTVHMPKIRIGLGTGGSLVTGSTSTNILVRNSINGEVELRDKSSLVNFSSAQRIPFMNTGGTDFNYSSNLFFNPTLRALLVGTSNTITSGTDYIIVGGSNTVTGGGWGVVAGELNTVTGGGGDLALFGLRNTTSRGGTLTYGSDNINQNANAFVGGTGAKIIIGPYGNVAGISLGIGNNPVGVGKEVFAFGGAVNISNNDSSQSVGHGAKGFSSVILGGMNHNIDSGSTNSIVIGGNAIKVGTGVTNTVHMPKVRIGLGTGGSLVTGSTSINLLVRNSSNGEIELRNKVSLSKSLFVDLNGNDSTAIKGSIDSPYKTLLAARNAATSGDTVFVFPGLYTENTNCAKNKVDWYFYDGAIIKPSVTNTSVFNTNSLGAVTFGVYGKGTFISFGVWSNDTTTFVISNSGTSVYIEAKSISSLEVWRSGKAVVKNTEFTFQTAVYEGPSGTDIHTSDCTFDNCHFNNSINFFAFYYGSGNGVPAQLKILNSKFTYNGLPSGYTQTGLTHYVPDVNVIAYTSSLFSAGGSGKAYYKNCDFYNLVGNNIYSKGVGTNTKRVIHTFDNCRFYCVDTSKKSIVYDDATDNEVIFRLINNYSNVGFGGAGTVTNQIGGSGFIVDNNFEVLK